MGLNKCSRLLRLQTSHPWGFEKQVGYPPYGVKPSQVDRPKQR